MALLQLIPVSPRLRRPARGHVASVILLGAGFLLGMTMAGHPDTSSLPSAAPESSPIDLPDARDPGSLFLPLLVNNLAAGAMLVLGGWTLGIMTVLGIVGSGFLWGLFFTSFRQTASTTAAIAMGLPHGLFEIGWIALLGGLGFRLAGNLWRGLRTGSMSPVLAPMREPAFVRTLGLALGLIVVAALIEAHLTIRITDWVTSR